MKKSQAWPLFCALRAFIPLLIALAIFTGCSKSGPSSNISSTAFDSAPADVKQLWSDGMSAWKKKQYPDAAKNFVSLRAKSANLSSQQADELTKVLDEFGQEALAAANKGDKDATEAVLALRNAGSRRLGGN